MTEQEWLNSSSLSTMVYFLRGRTTIRKWDLFAVACCRCIQHLLLDQRSRNAIAVIDRLAGGDAHHDDVELAQRLACAALADSGAARKRNPVEDIARVISIPTLEPASRAHATAMSVASVVAQMAWKEAMGTSRRLQDKRRQEAHIRHDAIQSLLLREVIGNPFHPVFIDPGWIDWNDGTVRRIAESIYDERAFDRMPILADALEDAGCNDPGILDHCRNNEPHVRGCWIVDLLLGKE
jgi:hypothetical protein